MFISSKDFSISKAVVSNLPVLSIFGIPATIFAAISVPVLALPAIVFEIVLKAPPFFFPTLLYLIGLFLVTPLDI